MKMLIKLIMEMLKNQMEMEILEIVMMKML